MEKIIFGRDMNNVPAVFANAELYPGQNICEETPLISTQYSWNLQKCFLACEYCLKPLEDAEETASRLLGENKVLPYMKECCDTFKAIQMSCNCGQIYCSPECQDKAWSSYHRSLCPTYDQNPPDLTTNLKSLVEMWRDYNPFCIKDDALVYLMLKYLAKLKQNEDPWANEHTMLSPQANFVQQFFQHIPNRMVEEMAGRIRRIFRDDFIDSLFTNPMKHFVMILQILNLQTRNIHTSAYAKWEENIDRFMFNKPTKECHNIASVLGLNNSRFNQSGNQKYCEGIGIYSVTAIFNHDCNPNAEIVFPNNDHNLVIRAVRPIGVGEKITLNYVANYDPLYERLDRQLRKKILLERHFLNCDCLVCQQEEFAFHPHDNDNDNDDDDDDEEDDDDAVDDADDDADVMFDPVSSEDDATVVDDDRPTG